jgi:hypothetical protein
MRHISHLAGGMPVGSTPAMHHVPALLGFTKNSFTFLATLFIDPFQVAISISMTLLTAAELSIRTREGEANQ